jgi:hypothetical protein
MRLFGEILLVIGLVLLTFLSVGFLTEVLRRYISQDDFWLYPSVQQQASRFLRLEFRSENGISHPQNRTAKVSHGDRWGRWRTMASGLGAAESAGRLQVYPMHYEDAITFLIEKLKAQPGVFNDGKPSEFDVYIPRVVVLFLLEQDRRSKYFPV